MRSVQLNGCFFFGKDTLADLQKGWSRVFKIGDYVVYKKDVCLVSDIKRHHIGDEDYYLLLPIDEATLKIFVPTDNGAVRSLIKEEQVEKLIEKIPEIEVIQYEGRLIENEYRSLMSTGKLEDLVRIIKTTYQRNKERLDHNKKAGDKDSNYFRQAERLLYNELSLVLHMDYETTKNYVIEKVEALST